jgi:hypothetical protein
MKETVGACLAMASRARVSIDVTCPRTEVMPRFWAGKSEVKILPSFLAAKTVTTWWREEA